MPGVYISYPFCAQKCTYCNFASGVFPRELEPRYVDSLVAEIIAAPVALAARNRVPGRRHAQRLGDRATWIGFCRCHSWAAVEGSHPRSCTRCDHARTRGGVARRRHQPCQPGRAILRAARTGSHRPQAHSGDCGARNCAAALGGHRQYQYRSDRRPSGTDTRVVVGIADRGSSACSRRTCPCTCSKSTKTAAWATRSC